MPRMQGKCYHRFLLWASWCIQLVLEVRGPKQAHGDCEDARRQQLTMWQKIWWQNASSMKVERAEEEEVEKQELTKCLLVQIDDIWERYRVVKSKSHLSRTDEKDMHGVAKDEENVVVLSCLSAICIQCIYLPLDDVDDSCLWCTAEDVKNVFLCIHVLWFLGICCCFL